MDDKVIVGTAEGQEVQEDLAEHLATWHQQKSDHQWHREHLWLLHASAHRGDFGEYDYHAHPTAE